MTTMEIKEQMCDRYCKYPERCCDDNLLLIYCNKCPLNELKEEEHDEQGKV